MTLSLPDPETVRLWMLRLGFALAGVLLGFVVATNNPLLIAVSVGAIFGLLLLNALQVALWALFVGVFAFSGPFYMFVPALVKTGWLFSILGFFLVGAAILHPALGRHRFLAKTPGFVWIGVAFVVWAVALALFSDGPIKEIIGGIKKYFQFWGVLFVLAAVPFAQTTVSKWLTFFGFLACIQLPLVFMQRVFLVPYLEVLNTGVEGYVAIDAVVGTFEGTLRGGGSSSVLALFLVLAIAYLLSAFRDGHIKGARFWWLFLLMFIPLGLGETKIVVVLLPLALFAIYLDLIVARPLMFIFGAIVTLFLALGFVYFYAVIQVPDAYDLSFEERIRSTIEYNFGNVGYFGGLGLNRFTAVVFWFNEHGLRDPLGTLFGHGLGSSYGGDGNVPNTGHINDQYPNKLIGQTSATSILWDLGSIGFLLFASMIVSAWFVALRLVLGAIPGSDRALCRLLLASTTCILPMLFYWDGITVVPSHQALTTLTLGLIAWRYRQGKPAPQATRAAADSTRTL